MEGERRRGSRALPPTLWGTVDSAASLAASSGTAAAVPRDVSLGTTTAAAGSTLGDTVVVSVVESVSFGVPLVQPAAADGVTAQPLPPCAAAAAKTSSSWWQQSSWGLAGLRAQDASPDTRARPVGAPALYPTTGAAAVPAVAGAAAAAALLFAVVSDSRRHPNIASMTTATTSSLRQLGACKRRQQQQSVTVAECPHPCSARVSTSECPHLP
jgi:hypothetical protein